MSDDEILTPPRLHVAQPLAVGMTLSLPERNQRHIAALRLRAGDAVTLFNGDGAEYAAELTDLRKRDAHALVRARHDVSRESPLAVTLVQGLCAADRMDLLIQKATELGAAAIQPVVTQRTIVRLSEERQERRETHWQNIAISACEQSGRNLVPEVRPLVKFPDFIAGPKPAGLAILLSPLADAALATLARPGAVTLLIGPEGGFTPEERAMALRAGYVGVRMGPRVLRTETAPLAAIAAIQVLWGDA